MSKESKKSVKAKVLVVDDDKLILRILEEFLTQKGFEPTLAVDGEDAERQFATEEFDVVLTDVMMPKVDGIELLRRIKEREPEIPVIIITGLGDDKIQANAWDRGAFLYITKPIDYNFLNLAIHQAVDKYSLIKKNRSLSEVVEKKYKEIIGASGGRMEELFSLISKVAGSNASILIQGESGTGKELVARAIHYHSSRKEGSFIAVNCAAIPKELMESELFGHVKGSFTGAIADKKGKFEMADGGSIFLDEIGDLDISLQAKILRALQEREFERVGGTKSIRVNIRLIAATNKDLSRAMKEGSFREDLYYRLSVIPLVIPPLRERQEDIPYLAEHFLIKYNQENGKNIKGVEPDAMKALKLYSWPGNVRELENCMERAVVMAETDRIRLSDLPLAVRNGRIEEPGSSWAEGKRGVSWEVGRPMREIEREYILKTLEEMKGNRTRTAEVLGISVRGLRDKLKEYGHSSTQD
jgi:DNA-binding NtrC family response regulator